MNSKLSFRNKQSGQAIVAAAVALVVLCGFTGLAIDMGALRYQRRVAQTAADAAAIAGAQNLNWGSGVTAGAQYASSQDGFTDGGSSALSACDPSSGTPAVGTTCVEIHNPPADVTFNGSTISGGPHASDAKYVEALVAQVEPTYFMNIFGVNSKTVVTRAVATNVSGGVNSSCLYTLGLPTSAIVGIDPTGNAKLIAPACGISDNGNLDTTGNSYTVQAATVSVGGSCLGSHCGSPDVQCFAYAGKTCPPLGGSPVSGDPLAGLTPPAMPAYSSSCPAVPPAGTCDYVSADAPSSGGAPVTIQPGTYNSITVGKNSVLIMAPGIYYFNGAITVGGATSGQGLNFRGGGTLCAMSACGGTDGVMLYFTNTSTMNKFAGGGDKIDLQLDPMTTAENSTYAGILIYQDPADTAQAWIGGDNTTIYNGTVYMPTATLNYYGNANFTSNGTTIAYSVAFTGNPTITFGTAPAGIPPPALLTHPILVE